MSTAVDAQSDYERVIAREDSYPGRPAALHQLTLNGAMLIAPNHDPSWLYWLSWVTDREIGSWSSISNSLRTCPGETARRILWRSSFLWWRERVLLIPDLAAFSFRVAGEPGPSFKREIENLKRVEHYLRETGWCESGSKPPAGVTKPSSPTIEIVE